jgi:hypothetical protein
MDVELYIKVGQITFLLSEQLEYFNIVEPKHLTYNIGRCNVIKIINKIRVFTE